MARKTLALVGLLCAVAVGSASAGEKVDMKGTFALSMGAGVGVPMGDYGDAVNTGPSGEFTAEYYVSRSLALGVRGAGMMGSLPDDGSGTSLNSTLGLGGFSVRFSAPTTKQEPYLMAAFGSGRRSIEASDGSGSTVTASNNQLGYELSGGMNFRVGEIWQLTTGVGYQVATKDSNDDTDTNWSAVHFNVGARVLFGGSH